MSQTWHLPLLTTDALSDSRGYLNDAFEALRSSFSGSSEPSSPVRGQWFIDTDNNTVRLYNSTAWTTVGDADLAYLGLLPRSAGSSYPLSGVLYCGNWQVKQVATPVDTTDAANKSYADTKLALAGGTMSGAITCGANKVTSTRTTPDDDAEFVRKSYVDGKLAKTGGTMTGSISMGSSYKVTSLATPTLTGDATNKSYVDGLVNTGHDHDGTEGAKVDGANLVAVGASNRAVPYTVSSVCQMVVPWGIDFVETFDIGVSYVNLCSVTLTLPSTSTNLWVQASIKGNSGYEYDIKITDASDVTLDEDTGWYNMPSAHLIPGTYMHRFSPATTGSYTIKAWFRVNSTGSAESNASLLVMMC